jgi:hypothetical protein
MTAETDEPPKRWHARRLETEPLKIPLGSVTEASRVVYLAAPLAVLATNRYDDGVRVLARLRPDVEILGARDLFRDTDDWKQWWPAVLSFVAEVVFISDVDRTIGAGVFQEALDARLRGIPVWFLDERGTLHSIYGVTFRFLRDAEPSRIAEVVPRSAKSAV